MSVITDATPLRHTALRAPTQLLSQEPCRPVGASSAVTALTIVTVEVRAGPTSEA